MLRASRLLFCNDKRLVRFLRNTLRSGAANASQDFEARTIRDKIAPNVAKRFEFLPIGDNAPFSVVFSHPTGASTDTEKNELELSKALVRRSVAELLRGYLRKGHCAKLHDHIDDDPREEAQAAFDHFVKTFKSNLQLDPKTTNRADWERLYRALDRYEIHVPIACNTGVSGTGKTTHLQLLCAQARRRLGYIDVYFTLGGSDFSSQTADKRESALTRLVCHILHGLVSHLVPLDIFLTDLKKVEHRCGGVCSFDDTLRKVMPMIIRDVRNASDDVPILIAADELRKWSGEPVVGEPSDSAVACLSALAALSQASAAAHVEAILRGAATPTGVVYVVASALSAVDPAKGLVTRPVHFLPLPPLNPMRFDTAVIDALEHVASPSDVWKIHTLLRTAVFATRHNARLLFNTAQRLHTLDRPIDVDIATAFRNEILYDLSVSAKSGVAKLKNSRDPSFIHQRALLRTLFHRSRYAVNGNGEFHVDMLSARRCDEVGIAAILRDFETRSDAVCMTPQAIRSVLKDTFFNDPLTSVEEVLVNRLCSAMQKVPSRLKKEEEGAEELYEVVLGSAFTLRVATLLEEMTLHELITGRTPPPSPSPHVDPFFTSTIVQPSKVPYVELAGGVCFRVGAVKSMSFTEAAEEQEKQGPPFRHEPITVPLKCEFQNEPTSTANPFFAHFENPYNLLLDDCVLVDAIVDGKRTKLLLGLQVKEHAIKKEDGTKGIADDFATVHQGKIEGFRKSGTFPQMKAWLDAQGIRGVVTVYAGPTCGSAGSPNELQSAQLRIDSGRDDPSIGSFFRHSCYMHHEHVRHWSPSVAYSGCDALPLTDMRRVSDC